MFKGGTVNWNRLGITILFISLLVGCTIFYPSKNPKGIDISPIFSIELSGDLEQLENIKKLLPSVIAHRKVRGGEMLLFGTPNNKKDPMIYRKVQISRFDTNQGAIDEYQLNKRTFTQGADWKLYKEEGSETNRYFSAYKAPWVNTNHGIPIGVITSPKILIAFLKRNILVVISYDSYCSDSDTDYIREVNEDILYVSDILKKSLRLVGAQQTATPNDLRR
jgi:hypothetical protein